MTNLLLTSQSRAERASEGVAPAAGAPRSRAMRLARGPAFSLVAATTAVLLAASSAPSPLYAVYQERYGFSAITLTGIFATYVLTLLAALLVVGRLSDVVGRRPVLAVALVVEALSTLLFLDAQGTGWLVAARAVQGLATGAAIGVLGAYLLDLQPNDGRRLGSLVNTVAPTGGLALGAVGTGVLVQYAPDPTRLVFVLLTVLFVVLAAAVALLPETVSRTTGALAVLRPRVAVPPRARRAFVAAMPTLLAAWALGGLVLSVGGSLVETVLGQPNHAVAGLVIGVFAGSGASAAYLARDLTPMAITRRGSAALFLGTVLFVAALAATSLTVFVIAGVVAGAGFGASFLGALRSLTLLAREHERAGLLSAVYVVSYLAFSVPAVVAGLLITHIGLRDTAVGYGVFVAVLALVRLVWALLENRDDASQAGTSPAEG